MFNTKEIVHVRLRRQEDKVSHGNRVLTFSATIVEHGYLISITSSRLRVPALVLARFVVGERVMPYGVESRSQQDHHTLARHCCSSVSLDRRPRGCGAPFVFCCWGSPHPWLWRPLDPICYIAPPPPSSLHVSLPAFSTLGNPCDMHIRSRPAPFVGVALVGRQGHNS